MSAARSDETNRLNKQLLLETIVYDLLWTTFHVGTLASLLNGCDEINADSMLRPWRHLLVDNNKIMQLALRYGTEIGLSEEATASTAKLYDGIAVEKRRLSAWLEHNARHASLDPIATAAVAWRRLAKEATAILSAFKDAGMHGLGGFLLEDARTILQFLGEAIAGSAKRISGRGEISLPVLKQMRHQPRMSIGGSCTILLGERSIPASLKDVSIKGLGIVCEQALPDNEALTVVLPDGRRLAAKVASRRGDHVGLLFETRLSYGDPLFRQSAGQHRHAQQRTAA